MMNQGQSWLSPDGAPGFSHQIYLVQGYFLVVTKCVILCIKLDEVATCSGLLDCRLLKMN